MSDQLIREYYKCFQERRFTDAAKLFADDAVVERPPFALTLRGGSAYVRFAERWLEAFPDARVTIQHVENRNETVCEVDLIATGTHMHALDLGPFGLFKPSSIQTTLRMRELLEVAAGRIIYSSLSFDLHDLVYQLANVDYAALDARLEAIQQLRKELDRGRHDRQVQREVTDRLGRELDAARLILRPWFRR